MENTVSWIDDPMTMDTCLGDVDYDVIDDISDCPEDHKENHIVGRKPHSTPLTLKWLEENYEVAEGVCIPRSTLYMHYLDFCSRNDSQPVNAASFGKIIRQQFPQITTRRLGTRGQSKYHYYGIAIRESSQYFELIYSRKGAQSCLGTEGHKNCNRHTITYNPRSKLGTLLPDFPTVNEAHLPLGLSQDKVGTFLMMYRTHCQRILDTVIRANFEEVQSFLIHFWQGMPSHLVPILDTATIVSLVGVCDSILFKVLANVLVPSVLQQVPESLTQVIRKFSTQFDEWLKQALYGLPENLRAMKFDLSRRFSYLLRRQISLNHLCHASRSVIHCGDVVIQMLVDWHRIDTSSICKQTLYTMDNYNEKEYETVYKLCREFEFLLEEQAPLENYTEWLDSLVDRCVVQFVTLDITLYEDSLQSRWIPHEDIVMDMPDCQWSVSWIYILMPEDIFLPETSLSRPGSLRKSARQFLLMWSCFGTRVIRDMTLHSAPSFGSFHLIHLMFDDYVLYLIENLHTNEHANELYRALRGESLNVNTTKQQNNNNNDSPNNTNTLDNLNGQHLSPSNHGTIADTYPVSDIGSDTSYTSRRQSVITNTSTCYLNARDIINNVSNSEPISEQNVPTKTSTETRAPSYCSIDNSTVDHQVARSSCQMDGLSNFASSTYEYSSCQSSQPDSNMYNRATSQYCQYAQIDYIDNCLKFNSSPDVVTSSIKDDWLQAYDGYYTQTTRFQNSANPFGDVVSVGFDNSSGWQKSDGHLSGNGYSYCQITDSSDTEFKGKQSHS